jgi:hypothetical protein
VGRRAWLFEVREFLLRRRRRSADITLLDFWGTPQDNAEEVVSLERWIPPPSPRVAELVTECSCEEKTGPRFRLGVRRRAAARRRTGTIGVRARRLLAQEAKRQ